MQEEKVRYLMEKFKKNLSQKNTTTLKTINTKLTAANDEAFEPLNAVTFKSKVAALLLSLFLGGVCAGRFYVGDYKYAIIKIVIVIALSLVVFFAGAVPVLGIILRIAYFIAIFAWYIYDIVKCYGRAMEINEKRILEVINAFPA